MLLSLTILSLVFTRTSSLPIACTKKDISKPSASSTVDRCVLLDLRSAGLTDASLLSAVVPFLRNHKQVRLLDISNNGVSATGLAAALPFILAADSAVTAPLLALIIGRNSIPTRMGFGARRHLSDAGAAAVAAALTLHFDGPEPSLVHLDVSNTQMGDEGAAKLAEALHSTQATLTKLDLSGNRIQRKGALALEATLTGDTETGAARNTHLRELDLSAQDDAANDAAIDAALLAKIGSLLRRNDRWRCAAAPTATAVDTAAMASCAGGRHGARCPLQCSAGFAPGGVAPRKSGDAAADAAVAPYLECVRGKWSEKAVLPGGYDFGVSCEALRCANSPSIEHATFVPSSQSAAAQRAVAAKCSGMVSGRNCPIRCEEGFALEDGSTEVVLKCDRGRWTGDAKCSRSWFKFISAKIKGASNSGAAGSAVEEEGVDVRGPGERGSGEEVVKASSSFDGAAAAVGSVQASSSSWLPSRATVGTLLALVLGGVLLQRYQHSAAERATAAASQIAKEDKAASAAFAMANEFSEVQRRCALAVLAMTTSTVAASASTAAAGSADAAEAAVTQLQMSESMNAEMEAAHRQIEISQEELKHAKVANATAKLSHDALEAQLRRSHATAESIAAAKQSEVDEANARVLRSEEESAAFVDALTKSTIRESEAHANAERLAKVRFGGEIHGLHGRVLPASLFLSLTHALSLSLFSLSAFCRWPPSRSAKLHSLS